MKERIVGKWNAILCCASLLSMLVVVVTAASVTIATPSITTTITSSSQISAVPTTTTASDINTNLINEIACPAIQVDSCSCYVFDDHVHLECQSTTIVELRQALAAFASVPVQSLSIYNLDKSATTIKAEDFAKPLYIRQLHISLCNINQLNEDSFRHIRDQLESLAIVSGKLRTIPHKTLPYMISLRSINLEANEITDLPNYSFYGLRLAELNLKANALSYISENAFAGLEETLELADLSANQLTNFPTAAVRRLRRLITLKLAWNVIQAIPDDGYSLLESLRHVDLGSNHFASIGEDEFRPLSCLRTLSLYSNGIEGIHRHALVSLTMLENLDLSYNNLVHVEEDMFRTNLRLKTIDLSHNHLYHIDGLFANLINLQELFLSENNVLEVPRNAFVNATALKVLHLQANAVRHIDDQAFAGNSRTFRQLHLSKNFVRQLPVEMLLGCGNLVTLNLDYNAITELQPATFAAASMLNELRLHNNHIAHIRGKVFEPLHRLVELYLQHNAIAIIETGAFSTLRSLQYVNLRGNVLHELGDIFWPHATSLISVQLDANQLVTLHNTTLIAQTNIEIVRLSCNRLMQLQYTHFADLRSVRNLYIANNVLSSIEDGALKAMHALLVLDLSDNQLRVISADTFAGLNALQELLVTSNQLEAIAYNAFAGLSKLRLLDLSGNRLTLLDAQLFHPSVPLERLLLHHCRLVTIDQQLLIALHHLKVLDLRANQLTNDVISQLQSSSLHILDLSINNLTHLPFGSLDGMPALQELRIEYNQLTLIESGALRHVTNLETFSVRGNQLLQLPDDLFQTTRRLRFLHLDENFLTTLPLAVINLVSIRQLSIAANRIGTSIDICALHMLSNLTDLNISRNSIITLTSFERCNFTRLVHLNLSTNLLTALPAETLCGSVSLRFIDLSTNQFTRVPLAPSMHCHMPNVKRLILENNPISQIREGNQPAVAAATDHVTSSVYAAPSPIYLGLHFPLHELIIGGCYNLSTIGGTDFDLFKGLVHLRLARNAIAHILPGAFQSLAQLTMLDIGNNRIFSLVTLGLRGLHSLNFLNLTRNALYKLDPFSDNLKALQILDLSYNQLVTLDRRSFRHLGNLTELHLQGNRIVTLSVDAFRWLEKLRMLDFASNEMRVLPLDAFRPLETRLRSLVLQENALVCGCAQEETWQWLRDHEKMMSSSWEENETEDSNVSGLNSDSDKRDNNDDMGALRCEEPAELRGRPFLQMEPFTFCASPSLVRLKVRNICSTSVNVSWEAYDYSHLRAYKIISNVVSPTSLLENGVGENDEEELAQSHQQRPDNRGNSYILDSDARWALVTQLVPNTRYLICVTGMGDEQWPVARKVVAQSGGSGVKVHYSNNRKWRRDGVLNTSMPVLAKWWSRCIEMRTLDDGSGSRGNHQGYGVSLLTRRLGLIVGSCMGCVVFAALVVILVYTKVKKQRENAKHQQPLPPEYLSYRHFSLHGFEQSATLGRSIAAADLASVALRQ